MSEQIWNFLIARSLAGIVLVTFAAASQAEGVHVSGVGTLSCGQYLELRERNNKAQNAIFASWVWGFLGGFNMEAIQPTKRAAPDEPSTLAYIDKHCRDNPLDNVIMATQALILQLGGTRNPL